jgi:RHS repeat-associated protein
VGNTNFYYDLAGRVTAVTEKNAAGTSVLDNFTSGYDSANRVTSETTQLTGATRRYAYDADSQLLSDGTTAVTYDNNGNRTNNGYSTPRASANELATDGTWNYTYDAEGNLTTKVAISTGTTFKYQYDNANHLTQVAEYTTAGGSAAVYKETYKYDIWGNRLEVDVYPNGDNTTNPIVTRFAYDQFGNAYADFDTTNHGSARRLYLQGTDALFARWDGGGQAEWYLTDRLGSVRDLTGSNGTIYDHLDYTGFGQVSSESNFGYGDRYKYAGREFDVYLNGTTMTAGYTNLMYERARYVDLNTTRFLQQDPIGLRGDINLYRNVGNDPANFTDPSGLQRARLTEADIARMNAATAQQGRGEGRGGLVDLSFWGQARTYLGAAWDGQYRGGVNIGRGIVNRARQLADVPVFFYDSGRTLYYGAGMYLGTNGPDAVLNQRNYSMLGQANAEAGRRGPQAWTEFYAGYWRNTLVGPRPDEVVRPWVDAIGEGIRTGNWDQLDQQIGGFALDTFITAATVAYNQLRQCFPAGTLVHTPTGLRAIEGIEAGEQVWAYDLAAGAWRTCKVLQTFCTEIRSQTVLVCAAGETVEATYRHPFWVVRGEELAGRPRLEHLPDAPAGCATPGRWVDAADLRVGDELLLRDGRVVAVEGLEVVPFAGLVYNFEVENLHCYAVGREGALVHNNNGANPGEANTSNRPGTRGHPDHRADVNGPGQDQARAQLQPGETLLTERPIQGHPGVNRRADNQVVGADGRTRLVVESERRPNGSYHRRRVEELEAAGIEVQTRVIPE